MLPSTTSIGLRQGLVERQEGLLTTSHMSFISQPSPLPPPHLTFTNYGGFQNPNLPTLTSSRVGGIIGSSSSSSFVQDQSTCNPWPWGEEGSIKRSTISTKEDLNINSTKKKANCTITNNINGNDNNISFNNSLSSVGAKRMKKVMKGRRKVREPRFCFKTMSEVDVLDDGYKWRKYGQKVVKNTQHPRSYYRCTQDNCRVKKRVERLAEDSRMVITTYEGRHAHSPPHDEDNESNLHPNSSCIRFFC